MSVEPLLATTAQRAFIATITIQAVVVLAMIITTFSLVDEYVNLRDARYKTLPCYLALFGLAEIFELFIAFDALRLRNIIQLIGLLIFHAALIICAALQVYETKTALVTLVDCDGASFNYVNCGGPGTLWAKVKPLLIVAPSVLALSWFFMLFFIKKLYEEFGWAIFHVVGANPKMKNMYRYYQIMLCFLKFDFFFVTGVTMQLLIVVFQTNSAEFGITIAAIPIVLALLVLCGLAVQREIKSVMTISLVLMLAALTYLYKLVRFYTPSSRDQYLSTRATLTAFTIIALVLLLASFAVGLRCFADFDRGLQQSKTKDVAVRHGTNAYGLSPTTSQKQDSSGAPLSRRVSIE